MIFAEKSLLRFDIIWKKKMAAPAFFWRFQRKYYVFSYIFNKSNFFSYILVRVDLQGAASFSNIWVIKPYIKRQRCCVRCLNLKKKFFFFFQVSIKIDTPQYFTWKKPYKLRVCTAFFHAFYLSSSCKHVKRMSINNKHVAHFIFLKIMDVISVHKFKSST